MPHRGAPGAARSSRKAPLVGALVASLLLPAAAGALDPQRGITQYSLAVWRTEDGLPQDALTSVAQDADGRLWLGTPAGLVSFDGREFRRLAASTEGTPADRYVTALLARPDGGLWATTRGALLEIAGDTVRRHAVTPEAAPAETAAMAQASDGSLWLAGGAGVLRFSGGRIERALDDAGRPVATSTSFAIVRDSHQSLWLATDRGLHLRAGPTHRVFSRRDGLPSDLVSSLAEDSAAMWAGTALGLARLAGGRVTIPSAARPLAGMWIRCLLRDRDGNLWIGTRGNGAYRLRGDRLDPFTATQGLPNDLVRQIYEDRDGAIWIVTAGGLTRLTDGPVTTWTTTQGLPSRFVWAVHEDRSGTLWIGTSGGGVTRLLPSGAVAPPPFSDPDLLGVEIRAFLTDRLGTLWIGTGGNGIATVRDGRVEWLGLGESSSGRWVSCLLEDRRGEIWAGTGDGVVRLRSGRVVARYRRQGRDAARQEIVRALTEGPDGTIWVGYADGLGRLARDTLGQTGSTPASEPDWRLSAVSGAGALDVARIHAIAVEPDGALWLATDGGLARFAGGVAQTWSTADGLPVDMLYWLIDDGEGHLWISSDLGLLRLPKRQVEELERGERTRLEPLVLGRADGMLATECNSGSPAGARRADGAFCFATTDGVSCVDPSRVGSLEEAPRVELHELLLDGAPLDVGGRGPDEVVGIPRGVRRVELRYAAISPVAAERVAYRYRLEGFDSAWIDAGAARSAQLTGLRSGSYRFAVAARRGGGQWSPAVTLRLEIEPAIYETYPFYLMLAGFLVLATAGTVRSRTRRLARRALELERQVEQRTFELGRANAELERQSLADGLTRIANRRHFDSRLDVEWRRAARAGEPLALVLADLDHFKPYNDAHGHVAGDESLRTVAASLVAAVQRAEDLVARYGGEEFAILLPGVGLDEAGELAERLRARVEDLALAHDRSPHGRVTLSLGVAAVVPDPRSRPETLVEAADRALYRAKNAGRNRVSR